MKRILLVLGLVLISQSLASAAYSFKRTLTIDHTKLGSTDLSNYPTLIHISDSAFRTFVNGGHVQSASAFDVGFFSDSGATVPLFWEVLNYNGSTGELWAFAKVPSVSHTVDTVFYVFYGDASLTTFQSTVSSVWSAYYKVMHLNENGHPYLDVTVNANTSTSTNDPTQASGKFNLGQSFVGASAQSITVPVTGAFFETATSGWMKSSITNQYQAIIDTRGNASHLGQLIGSDNTNKSFFYRNNASLFGSSGFNDGNWHYVVGTTGISNVMTLFVDGVFVASNLTVGNPEQTGLAYIGQTFDPFYLTGMVQEVRETLGVNSSSFLTAAWILTDYHNQNSPDTFLALGPEAGGSIIGTRRIVVVVQ